MPAWCARCTGVARLTLTLTLTVTLTLSVTLTLTVIPPLALALTKVHGDGACDIDYDDGDREDKVPRKFLRLPPPTKVKAGAAAQEAPRAPQLQQAPAAAPQISEYEQQRLQRVAANRQKLADLDLLSARLGLGLGLGF